MADKERTTRPTTVRNARANASEKGTRGESRMDIQAESRADTRGERHAGTRSKNEEDICSQLAAHVGALRFVNCAMIVCIQALQQQDADMDAEIALVLQRTAGDKLDETTDRIEAIALGIEYDADEGRSREGGA